MDNITIRRSHYSHREFETQNVVEAWVNEIKIDPKYSLVVLMHSPDGFEYGYEGSGPSQLALAILLEAVGREKATTYYQDFKRQFIATLDQAKEMHQFDVDIGQWVTERENALA